MPQEAVEIYGNEKSVLFVRKDCHLKIRAGIRTAYDAMPLVKGRSNYSDKYQLELHEAFALASPTDTLDIKVGRQIVVWGVSESLRITDVLNPMDRQAARPGRHRRPARNRQSRICLLPGRR